MGLKGNSLVSFILYTSTMRYKTGNQLRYDDQLLTKNAPGILTLISGRLRKSRVDVVVSILL